MNEQRRNAEGMAMSGSADLVAISRELANASDPFQVRDLEAKIDGIETYMKRSGLWTIEEIRPVVETRIRARHKLGGFLRAVERGKPFPGSSTLSGLTRFKDFIAKLNLTPPVALEAQRLSTLPEEEREQAFAELRARDPNALPSLGALIVLARPYWYQESRKARHEGTAAKANGQAAESPLGPFPLIYADPPWKFEIYSDKGLERTPDQHYPTLSDAEIMDFHVGEKLVSEIAHRDAALLLWCTSSNLERAVGILGAWGLTFKTSAVWVKDKTGLGLVFRNQHELLLYGTRGAMPGPQYQPPSVFSYPRGAHSAKPPEIRAEIERMYPDFDRSARIELFARGDIEGWTTYGFETDDKACA
ncbi:MT-A70 family methyltransferase [Rhizobiaceae bacterium n13]|uniref:MT-A70 family methyltransferase n=1 Tax=Ferirhizobium litorale TaxID=2927786 RepID=A0AAE3QFJ0_9HYPH|nr:MT-A70 family methyltransferase [Fererhizobium litorale]MDI7863962.1 MT-A70 family methyltransferase [Fererhizobium litorale]MDI7924205.1 MT-A70 family methyltransferase [Fererhizobium litorale]